MLVEFEVAVLFERAILASKYTLRKILIIVVNEDYVRRSFCNRNSIYFKEKNLEIRRNRKFLNLKMH